MKITEKARLAIESLRNAPEENRTFGLAVSETGKMCACGFLAKPLGIDLYPGILTDKLVREISEKSGIPMGILNSIPKMNDANDAEGNPLHTFSGIADALEESIAAWNGRARSLAVRRLDVRTSHWNAFFTSDSLTGKVGRDG